MKTDCERSFRGRRHPKPTGFSFAIFQIGARPDHMVTTKGVAYFRLWTGCMWNACWQHHGVFTRHEYELSMSLTCLQSSIGVCGKGVGTQDT